MNVFSLTFLNFGIWKHVSLPFFLDVMTLKFVQRGYCRNRIGAIIAKHPFDSKHLKRLQADTAKRVVPLKIPYFNGLESLHIGKILTHHAQYLDYDIRNRHSFIVCNVSNVNLLRLRHSRFT